MKTSQKPEIKLDDTDFEELLKDLRSYFEGITSVESYERKITRDFVTIFLEIFVSNAPSYPLEQNQFGANRSNWTYHTAFTIKKTCEILSLNCKFETEGRLDAVIEAFDQEGNSICVFFAEWEWDYLDIFGKGKELEKLWEGTHKLQYANALMFTYCPIDKYFDFLKQVTEYWQQKIDKMQDYPRLFLVTVLHSGTSFREFQNVRTVEIDAEQINLWYDLEFRSITSRL